MSYANKRTGDPVGHRRSASQSILLHEEHTMRIAAGSPVPQRTPRSARRGLTRAMLAAVGTLGLLLVPARTSTAQTAGGWEFRVPSGGLLPTGAQRDALKDAHLSAAQLSYRIRPAFAITATVGWARSRDLASTNDPKLDVFTYDLGAEARASEWFAGRAVTFTPFAGLGAGARSYNHRKLDVVATHNVAGYGTVGGELGMGRVGLRVEARDYVTGFKPLVDAGASATRNDVVVLVGLTLRKRGA
jgi:hypothetical protein